MAQHNLHQTLKILIDNWENEVVEFKEASDSYSTHEIGKYFSALSNEANLRQADCGWLVFGVSNRTRTVVGTDYREDAVRLNSLKQQITDDTEPSTTFRQIHTLVVNGHRVVMMQIPPAPQGIPIAWKGHYYARSGESLSPLGISKQDDIRAQAPASDWTAQVVEDATMDDLDQQAIQRARENFALKNKNRIDLAEISDWPLATLLDRARLTQRGKITRTALLLLGRQESSYLLSPHPAQMTWKLVGQERAYEHFGPPFLISTTALYQRIRNVQLRLLPEDELLPYEVAKYDQKVVLEALHNCIAHQDYHKNHRIIVTEQPDRLVFENSGHFFEGEPEDYVSNDRTPRGYRNPFLVQAMAALNMIDQMGFGIQQMFEAQRQRYLPLPDYESPNDDVVMTLHGGVVDPAYTRALMANGSLPLSDVLALDRVQKGLEVPDAAVRSLKRQGLIEGRKPRFRVSSSIAAATERKAEYIKNRAFDDQHYADLVVEFLSRFDTASRKEIDHLLWDKLSDTLTEDQKKAKIGNIISKLRIDGIIINTGSRTAPQWKKAE